MKPVTHPIAIAYMEAMASTDADVIEPCVAWHKADCPLYADPTPMPAPALGMRVWVTAPDIGGGAKCRNYDIHSVSGRPVTWSNWINEYDTIDLITDFRTGEVLWRRS